MPAMTLLYSETLSADAASFEIEDIPPDYAHLLIVVEIQSTVAAANTTLRMRCNGDTGSSYHWAIQAGYAAGTSGLASSGTSVQLGFVPGTSSDPLHASIAQITIPDYAGSVFAKHMKSCAGMNYSGGIQTHDFLGSWFDADPITDLSIFCEAGNCVEGSTVTVYGLAAEVNDQKISQLSAITDLVGTEEFVVADAGTSKKITADDLAAAVGGGGGSPVDIPPSSPDAFDDEFDDSASLSDWTAYGSSFTTEDIDTTVPGRLYLLRSAGTDATPAGRYKAISTTGTYLVKIGATSGRENYHRSGCVYILPTGAITGSSPCVICGWVYASSLNVEVDRHSALGTYSDQAFQGGYWGRLPALYVRLAFASATSVTVDFSADGIGWIRAVTSYNPGWNMDKIGWGVSKESGGSYAVETSFDYFRKIA